MRNLVQELRDAIRAPARTLAFTAVAVVGVLPLLAVPGAARAQGVVPWDSPRWERGTTNLKEIAGRHALEGVAVLPDADFEDGVVEYDLYVTGARSYPGVYFRLIEGQNAEHFYVRPHRAGLYPDALQYAPVINGIAEWQFYNGPGYTAAGVFTENKWIPVRVEVKGRQARVFVEDLTKPALVIPHLEGRPGPGGVGVTGPTDGSAYFSNFRYDKNAKLDFDPPPERKAPEGMVRSWSVSQAIPVERIPRDAYPGFVPLFLTDWKHVDGDEQGLVDIADRTPRKNPSGDVALARHVFYSEEDRVMNLTFGYSDDIDLFFNGRRVFSGQSRYQGRDPSFLGIVGLFDQVPVQVRKGLNEIFLMDTEVFGGWGFMIQADRELAKKPTDLSATREVWATPDTFLTPESVLKDPERDVLYVTNFDTDYARKTEPSGFLSRLSLDGKVLDLKWVEGLNAPCGMDIWHDTLFAAERHDVVAIDLSTGTVTRRLPIPDADFPNDLIVDDGGTIYVSDTRSQNHPESRIYRFRNGVWDVFANAGLDQANGLWIRDGWLIVGSSGDGMLKRVNLQTGKMEDILSFGAGILDGIRVDERGDLLISHWDGHVYRVSSAGDLVEILDTASQGWNTADFEYLPEQKLLVLPTFLDNRVRAVRIVH